MKTQTTLELEYDGSDYINKDGDIICAEFIKNIIKKTPYKIKINILKTRKTGFRKVSLHFKRDEWEFGKTKRKIDGYIYPPLQRIISTLLSKKPQIQELFFRIEEIHAN